MNSFVVVACVSDRRWFDLDAVRNPDSGPYNPGKREWDRNEYGPASTGVALIRRVRRRSTGGTPTTPPPPPTPTEAT